MSDFDLPGFSLTAVSRTVFMCVCVYVAGKKLETFILLTAHYKERHLSATLQPKQTRVVNKMSQLLVILERSSSSCTNGSTHGTTAMTNLSYLRLKNYIL